MSGSTGNTRRRHFENTPGRSACNQESRSRNDVLLTLLPGRVTCPRCLAYIGVHR